MQNRDHILVERVELECDLECRVYYVNADGRFVYLRSSFNDLAQLRAFVDNLANVMNVPVVYKRMKLTEVSREEFEEGMG